MSATLNLTSHTERSDKFKEMKFGKFKISPSQVFYMSPSGLSYGLVNLRPIVTGHVLVVSTRVVPRLSDLTDDEYDDLWQSVRTVQKKLEGHYSAGGFNIAIQDGKVSGQSVPHVHVHILPRVQNDFERNDDVYDELQDWAPTEASRLKKLEGKVDLQVPDDEDRRDRTIEEMEMESSAYRALFDE